MSKNPYGTNPEMLLLFAWLSTQDLAGFVCKHREAEPWERPSSWDRSWNPPFPVEIIRDQVKTALCCFHHDPIYGPVLEAIARDRLTYIDFSQLAWAIELQDLADPHAALYVSNNPSYAKREQKSEVVDETDAFWRVACSHIPLADRLKRLSAEWHADVCLGAEVLHMFFTWYLELIGRPLHVPFFLIEYVRMSLLKIDWHKIAANLLGVPHTARENCDCAARGIRETVVGAIAEYLGELFKVTGDEIMPLGQRLPEPERTQVLLLGDLCRETTKALRLFLINGEVH